MRLFLLLSVFVFSCTNNSSDPIEPKDSVVQDGTVVADTSVIINDTLSSIIYPNGIYSGVIKCKGCKTLEQTVAFLPGRNFRMEEKQGGRIDKTAGTWMPSGGTIWLYQDQVVKARYIWEGDTLFYRHANGEKTLMEKKMAATDNDVWRKKGKEGLEFYGVGNEPFWNVDIDEQTNIQFQLADWDKPMVFKTSLPTVNKDSIVYKSGKDTTSIAITIYNSFCSDGMSDYVYNNHVTVRFKGVLYNGCGILFRR